MGVIDVQKDSRDTFSFIFGKDHEGKYRIRPISHVCRRLGRVLVRRSSLKGKSGTTRAVVVCAFDGVVAVFGRLAANGLAFDYTPYDRAVCPMFCTCARSRYKRQKLQKQDIMR